MNKTDMAGKTPGDGIKEKPWEETRQTREV